MQLWLFGVGGIYEKSKGSKPRPQVARKNPCILLVGKNPTPKYLSEFNCELRIANCELRIGFIVPFLEVRELSQIGSLAL